MDRLYFPHDALPAADRDEFYRIVGMYQYDRLPQVIEAADLLEDRLRQHPAVLAELHRMRGYCRVELGDLAGGITDYTAATHIAPELETPRRNLASLPRRVSDELEQFHDRHRWHELAALGEAASVAWPADSRFAWSYAVGLDVTGRTAEAATVLAALIERSPDLMFVWRSLFVVFDKLGREPEAVALAAEGVRVLRERHLNAGELEELVQEMAPGQPQWPVIEGGAGLGG